MQNAISLFITKAGLEIVKRRVHPSEMIVSQFHMSMRSANILLVVSVCLSVSNWTLDLAVLIKYLHLFFTACNFFSVVNTVFNHKGHLLTNVKKCDKVEISPQVVLQVEAQISADVPSS